MAAILIIEDEHALGHALELAVRRIGHVPTLVASGGRALKLLESGGIDAVVLDIGLPDMSGIEVLERLRAAGSSLPVLVITAHAMLENAIASRRLGISEYLMKPLDLSSFEQAVAALVSSSIRLDGPPPPSAVTLIGTAPAMHRVFVGVARACCGEMPVLVCGPSGSGKSLTARVIHNNSPRGGGQFRSADCSMLHDEVAWDELWSDTTGTLVLEGLDALSAARQAELAERIGANAAQTARLVATLTCDGDAADLLHGALFYALKASLIEMPPLRERSGDIPALCRFFHGMRTGSAQPLEITAPALAALQVYEWPGNVRELQHALSHAWAMGRGEAMRPGHLPPHVAEALREGEGLVAGELDSVVARWLDLQLESTPEREWRYDGMLEKIEAAMLGHLMERFGGRPTHLASALGMNRATLRKKLRAAGIAEEE
jgi:DNA-binding NtrC family response regulator